MAQSLSSIRKKQARGLRMSVGTKIVASLIFLVAFFVTGEIWWLGAMVVVLAAGIAMTLFMRSINAKLDAGAATKTAAGDAKTASGAADDSAQP